MSAPLRTFRLDLGAWSYRGLPQGPHAGEVMPTAGGYVVAWVTERGDLLFVGDRPFREPPECLEFLRRLAGLLKEIQDDAR